MAGKIFAFPPPGQKTSLFYLTSQYFTLARKKQLWYSEKNRRGLGRTPPRP
jgi:hypothetical protein